MSIRMIAPVQTIVEQDTIEWLPLNILEIDPSYQRPISSEKVQAISKNYNERSVGTLLVNVRSSGQVVVMDGQHRLEAMKKRGLLMAECKVYRGLPLEQEAAIYIDCNLHRKMPQALDMFRARLINQDPIIVAIAKVVEECGLTIQYLPMKIQVDGRKFFPPRTVRAVACLETIFRTEKEDGLRYLLRLAMRCWPEDGSALEHRVLLGLHHFHRKYKGRYLPEELIAKMNIIDLNTIYRRANYHSENGGGGGYYVAFSKALQEAYDKGRRTRRLEQVS